MSMLLYLYYLLFITVAIYGTKSGSNSENQSHGFDLSYIPQNRKENQQSPELLKLLALDDRWSGANRNMDENGASSSDPAAKPRYYSDEQKLQILEKFYAMQEAYRIEKKQKMSKKLSTQFAKEMGVHINSIYNWNHRLGFKQRIKKYYEAEKRQIIQHFDQIKAIHYTLSKAEIDEAFIKGYGVNSSTILFWKIHLKKYENEE